MKLIANALILIGFCLGTLGATGFHNPSMSANADKATSEEQQPDREPYAMLLFACGLGTLVLGGFLAKASKSAGPDQETDSHAQGAALLSQITAVEAALSDLHQKAPSLSSPERHQAITELSEGLIYDVTSQFEHWTEVLGFDRYAQVWTGIATGERLVQRAWSMETDGHPEEAIQELQFAASAFGEAKAQLQS